MKALAETVDATTRRLLGWAFVALGAVFGLSLLPLFLRDAGDPAYFCSMRHAGAPPDWLRGDGEVSWWPVGLRCSYTSARETVVTDPGWALTIGLLCSIALVGVGIGMLLRRVSRRRSRG